ncbi:MAG: replicative DNA helicase [Saprospiraceae bacterium]|jgi:replicative DNA helicase
MAEGPQLTPVGGGKLRSVKGEVDANALLYGRVMPQVLELEEGVLGAVLVDRDGLPSVIEILRKESFYKEAHAIIYETMLELFEKSQPIDLLTVHEALKKKKQLELVGGVNYLLDLTNKVASSANIEFHARIVAQKYIQRELIRVSTVTIKDAYSDEKDVFELLDIAEQNLYEITDTNLNTGYEKLSALAIKTRREIEEVGAKEEGLTGVPTGFDDLDAITSGWQKSDLIIIAARPGMGKTAFTLSLAANAAKAGKGVAIFSLEMANTQLVQRLIAMDASINSHKLRNGKLTPVEWEQLNRTVDNMAETPIYIDDTPAINIFELRAKCRRLKQNNDIELIVIDYLQLMTAAPNQSKGNREQEISSISRALKGLAKELSVPVIALSQLSRAVETRGGSKRPVLSDLRESGAIEQDADIVTFIYRPGYYEMEEDFDTPKDLAEIIIAKHRNGGLDTVELRFIPHFVRFENGNFNKFTEPDAGSEFRDPMASYRTLPSRMNSDPDDTPF